jgi:hypothetical protein
MSCEIGFTAPGIGLRCSTQEHNGGADGNTVFVADSDLKFVKGVWRNRVSLGETRAREERQRSDQENEFFDECGSHESILKKVFSQMRIRVQLETEAKSLSQGDLRITGGRGVRGFVNFPAGCERSAPLRIKCNIVFL